MLDLVNVNVGGHGFDSVPVRGSNDNGKGVKRVATPKRPITDGTVLARKILKAFNTLEEFDPDFAREFWDMTNDSQKMKVVEFAESLYRELQRRIEFLDLHTVTEEHLAEVYSNE